LDLEDQRRIVGWEWILGSQAFAETLAGNPDAVVVVDMVGDADLNLYREKTSTPELVEEIWSLAAELGYGEYFISTDRHALLDDHTPFLNQGISAIDIIDFDYPYWHTLEDTADKVAPGSLKIVGDVLLAWLTR
jgi:Zn-dependent M28 family amino/carboxypeptidase